MTNELDRSPASQESGPGVPVSVIIPCYCCADTIERAVESVMAQTVLPTEIWLVEDGTEDGGRTLAKLHQLQRSHGDTVPIGVIPLGRNLGGAVARNAGWDASTQPYIAFLDADDAWHPRKLEIQHSWMQARPEVALTGHGWVWLRSYEPFSSLPERWNAQRVSRRAQLMRNRFTTISVMLQRELPYRFTETSRFNQDFDLWLKIVLDGYPAWRLGMPLASIFKAPYGEGGLSGKLWEMEKAEFSTYWRQVRERRLHLLIFIGLVPWSLLKYLRRLILKAVRRRASSG